MNADMGTPKTGFYVLNEKRDNGFQRLGYTWMDQLGRQRQLEFCNTYPNSPEMICQQLKAFTEELGERMKNPTHNDYQPK